MAAKSNDYARAMLDATLTNVIASGSLYNLGDALLPSVTAGDVEVHLLTATPLATWGSAQVTANEPVYSLYAAQSVPRSVAGWTVVGGGGTAASATNAADIVFPTSDGGAETVTHVCVMDSTSVTVLYFGALTQNLNLNIGITPQIDIGDLTITED